MSDHITEDTIAQILTPLPVKTLLRFRCVSQLWKQVIDSPNFMLGHLALQNPSFLVDYAEPGLLVVNPLPTLAETIRCTELPKQKLEFTLLGTLHGVVCLYDNLRKVLLWNASIRKLARLPPVPLGREWHDDCQIMACRGFWIDPKTKEFKVVIFAPRVNPWLYSSIRRRWIIVPGWELANSRARAPFEDDPAVVVGGVAHWRVLHWYKDNHGGDHWDMFVLVFDFGRERFEVIEIMGDDMGLEYSSVSACCWKGVLSVLCVSGGRCEILSRREGLWVKMIGFNLGVPLLCALWPVEAMGESGGVIAMITNELGRARNDLGLYGTKSRGVVLKSGMQLQASRYRCYSFCIAYGFVESLLFP